MHRHTFILKAGFISTVWARGCCDTFEVRLPYPRQSHIYRYPGPIAWWHGGSETAWRNGHFPNRAALDLSENNKFVQNKVQSSSGTAIRLACPEMIASATTKRPFRQRIAPFIWDGYITVPRGPHCNSCFPGHPFHRDFSHQKSRASPHHHAPPFTFNTWLGSCWCCARTVARRAQRL